MEYQRIRHRSPPKQPIHTRKDTYTTPEHATGALYKRKRKTNLLRKIHNTKKHTWLEGQINNIPQRTQHEHLRLWRNSKLNTLHRTRGRHIRVASSIRTIQLVKEVSHSRRDGRGSCTRVPAIVNGGGRVVELEQGTRPPFPENARNDGTA